VPGGWSINTGDDIEDSSFARTVWADKADKFALIERECEIGQGLQAAEVDGEVGYFKKRHGEENPKSEIRKKSEI
jgi:hypothetical protein